MTTIPIERILTDDAEVLEAWERITEDKDLLGVSAVRLPDDSWPWQVFVSMAKSVRMRASESQLETAVTAALEAVVGVDCVEREEPGLWVVAGSVNGRDLVLAVASIVDSLAPEAQLL